MAFNRKLLLLPVLLAGLSGCASSERVSPPCCYSGPVTLASLEQLSVRTTSGRILSIQQALPGFQSRSSLVGPTLPFREISGEDIIYASLEPLLAVYDSNRNDILERPEFILLYLSEALRGLGVKVDYFAHPEPVRALVIPSADISGLVHYVKTHLARMNPEGRKIFADLESAGIDLRYKSTVAEEPDEG